MRRVLEEDVQYGYLQDGALKHLADARAIARKEGILSSIFSGEAGHLLLHPWLGTRKLNTLGMLLRTALKEPLGIYTIKPFQCGLGIEIQRNPEAGDFLVELKKRLASVDEADISLDSMNLVIDRYDPYVPRELLEKAYRLNRLDVGGLCAALADGVWTNFCER